MNDFFDSSPPHYTLVILLSRLLSLLLIELLIDRRNLKNCRFFEIINKKHTKQWKVPNPHQKSHFALLLLLNFCWIDKLVILKIQLSFDLKIKRQEHIPPLWFPHTQPATPRWPRPHYSSPNVSLLLKIVDCCWTKTWNIRTAIYLMLM